MAPGTPGSARAATAPLARSSPPRGRRGKGGTQTPDAHRDDQVQDPEQVPDHENAADRKAGSADKGAGDPRGGHPDGDVPQAGRPGEGSRQHPVGVQGQEPEPARRQAWIAVARGRSRDRTYARKAGQPQYAPRNTITGAVAAMRMGNGGVPGGRAIAPAAPSRKTTTNQRTSTPRVIGLMAASRWSQERVLWPDAELSRRARVRGGVTDGARALTAAPATSLALCKDSMATLAEGK